MKSVGISSSLKCVAKIKRCNIRMGFICVNWKFHIIFIFFNAKNTFGITKPVLHVAENEKRSPVWIWLIPHSGVLLSTSFSQKKWKVLILPLPTVVLISLLAINVRCYFKASVKGNEKCWHFYLTLLHSGVLLLKFAITLTFCQKKWKVLTFLPQSDVLKYLRSFWLSINDRCYFKPSVKRNEKCWHFHLNLARCHVLACEGSQTKNCNKQVNRKSIFW